MRRQLSSIILLFAIPLLSQSPLKEVELSLPFQPGKASSHLVAYLSFKQYSNDSLRLIFSLPADSVKFEQGRVKQKLSFRQKKNELILDLPKDLDARSRIVVYYQFQWQEGKSPYLQKSGKAWVLNALNLVEKEKTFAQPGFLYPVIDNQPHHLKVNLHLPQKLNFELPGKLEYTVSSEKSNYYFTATEKPIKAESFYLVLGDFEDAEEFVEEEGLAQALRGNLAAIQIEQKIGDALSYFSTQSGRLLVEGDLEKIARVENFDTSGFFLQAHDVDANPETMALLKAAALYFSKGNKSEANKLHYAYFENKLGENWELKFLHKQLGKKVNRPDFFWQQYLNRLLQEQNENLNLSDTSQLIAAPQSKNDAYLWFAREMYKRRQPIKLTVNYRYLGSKSQQLLLFSQPDSMLRTAIPLEVLIYTAGEEVQHISNFIQLGLNDTLRIPLRGAPNSLRLRVDSLLPVELNDQRPQTYLLYELGQGESPAIQQEALLALLNNSNQALKATVVGIGLGSKDARVQMRALQAVESLNASGKAKIELSLRNLAKNASVSIVQQKARELINRFY